jgi:hypothetical protein
MKGLARALVIGFAVSLAGGAAAVSTASCSQTPVNVPVRTFERAQKMDVVCMRVFKPDPRDPRFEIAVPPEPVALGNCAPVPSGADGRYLPYHLYALVTQTARGEIAVVDMTASQVIDTDRTTPGINFVPVGALPTDLAATPDSQMTIVAAAEPGKPALYALPSRLLLGDSQGLPADKTAPNPTLPELPVCKLPQTPIAVAIVPRTQATQAPAPASDAGADAASDAGADAASADAGATQPDSGAPDDRTPYEIAVVLAADARQSAKLALLDPDPFLRGAGIKTDSGPRLAPGSLAPCPIVAAQELAQVTADGVATQTWSEGLPYLDGGIDLSLDRPRGAGSCLAKALADAGAEGGAQTDAAAPSRMLDAPRPVAAVRDGTTLYVADDALPIIHVFDLSQRATVRELPPLSLSSVTDPSRLVTARDLAVSPATRDYKRYLYAIDKKDGTIIVFDVTDPATSPRTPLLRPHAELNPFQPPDRIAFNIPVASVAFARHERLVSVPQDVPIQASRAGLLCNPNPNAGIDQGPFLDDGAYYRANVSNTGLLDLGPQRLRGVFAFATLSDGKVVAIDVDDWDAPCRRPDPTGGDFSPAPNCLARCNARLDACRKNEGLTDPVDCARICALGPNESQLACTVGLPCGSLLGAASICGDGVNPVQVGATAAPQPPPLSPQDLDPYHAPVTVQNLGGDRYSSPVTLEAFYPVSAPHRARSLFLLRNDPRSGDRTPHLASPPQLFFESAPLATVGKGSEKNPILLPPTTPFADPSYLKNPTEANPARRRDDKDKKAQDPFWSLPLAENGPPANVRFAFDDPMVHIDQDWTVTYEGAIPGFDGVAAFVEAGDGYETLTLRAGQPLFCRRGVEDLRVGQQRASAIATALADSKLPAVPRLERKIADYVQLTDAILPKGDPYWQEPNDCWAGLKQNPDGSVADLPPGDERWGLCNATFGGEVDHNTARDFPILEAYDDRLVVGRYGYEDPNARTTDRREVVSADPSNAPFLKSMRCCFHNQVRFKVRSGGQWVALGSAVGMLHHVVRSPDAGACVLSCESKDMLMSSRAPTVPRPVDPAAVPPDRNSPLALRNPMFSFVVWGGQAPLQRETVWKFAARGQFTPLIINLASSTTSVSPQSMRFIDVLGQLAVVDGASQGLILIDLDAVNLARAPYF